MTFLSVFIDPIDGSEVVVPYSSARAFHIPVERSPVLWGVGVPLKSDGFVCFEWRCVAILSPFRTRRAETRVRAARGIGEEA